MKYLNVDPRAEPHQVELLPDAAGNPLYSGHTFAGGKIIPGEGANILQGARYGNGRWKGPSPEVVLGVLALITVGKSNEEVCDDLKELTDGAVHLSVPNINHVRGAAGRQVGVSERHTLLPALLRNQVFQLVRYGDSDNFRATPYELVMLGLLGRGVKRAVVAEACGAAVSSVSSHVHKIGWREGTEQTAGGIAGAILTRHMGATSCVPLLPSDETVSRLMPVEQWDRLVLREDMPSLKALFSELAKEA